MKAITTGQVPPVISAIGQSAGTCIKKASGASSYDPEAIKAAACACFSNWFGDVLQLNELVNSAEAVPGDYETEALKRVAAYYDLDAEPSVARTQGAMAEATLISSLSDDELASLESQAMSDAHKLREKVRADRVQLTATARTVREVRDDLARSVKNGNDNMGCPADLKLP